jgi:general stress protein 26
MSDPKFLLINFPKNAQRRSWLCNFCPEFKITHTMTDTKNLENQEALNKIKEMAEKIDFCMFCTHLAHVPFETRPMSTRMVDEQGNIWFFSRMDSFKNENILEDNRVQLLYAKPGDSEFLSVYGRASIIKDREKSDELWTVFAKTWFQEGKDDPELSLIKVVPESAHYWDTKHGKMVSLLKIAASVITGKTMDDGIEGEIRP